MKMFMGLLVLLSAPVFAKFTHESEVSTVSTGGNSDVETYLVRTVNENKTDENAVRFGGHYTYGEARGDVSARDWDVNGKYERSLSAKTAYLIQELIEGYRFQGVKARYNQDIGLKYYYIKSETRNFFSELGYRYTIEDRYFSENGYENKGRLFNEYNHSPTLGVTYRIALEYVPNFTDSRDYLVNGDASVTSVISSIFSIKVGYRFIYDDAPAIPGNKNYDYTYSTSFVARF